MEDAIRKIDRETRELLRETFDSVNRHFGSMFPALFGGGEAKLIMTGEEILDSGVQVMAQPPGKRNSSIHLLSGGEKALTAIVDEAQQRWALQGVSVIHREGAKDTKRSRNAEVFLVNFVPLW